MKKLFFLFYPFVFVFASCNQSTDTNSTHDDMNADKEVVACIPEKIKLDIPLIEQITGMKGVEKNGEYKITVPQNDLNIIVDGFKIIPPNGVGKLGGIYTLQQYSNGNG